MDTQAMPIGRYHLTTLRSELDISYADFMLAHDQLKRVHELNAEQLFNALRIYTLVEHEYFHHRLHISSTLGYAVFLLKQFAELNLKRLISATGSISMARAAISGCALELASPLESSALAAAAHWIVWSRTAQTLMATTAGDLAEFAANKGLQAFYRRLYASDGEPNEPDRPMMMCNIRAPSQAGLELLSKAPTTVEILEGLALWKEYAVLSRWTWHNAPHRFSDMTHRWLNLSQDQPHYRNAPDLVFRMLGCNLCTLLSGVAMELALQGPLFADDPHSWDEVHPSIRLIRILDVLRELPHDWRHVDNIHITTAEFYKECTALVCRRLGWRTPAENLSDAIGSMYKFVNVRKKKLAPQNNLFIIDIASIYESQFNLGLSMRLAYPGCFTSPEICPDREQVGYLSQPMVQEFRDRAVLNRLMLSLLASKGNGEHAADQILSDVELLSRYFVADQVASAVLEHVGGSGSLSREFVRRIEMLRSKLVDAIPDCQADGAKPRQGQNVELENVAKIVAAQLPCEELEMLLLGCV